MENIINEKRINQIIAFLNLSELIFKEFRK